MGVVGVGVVVSGGDFVASFSFPRLESLLEVVFFSSSSFPVY